MDRNLQIENLISEYRSIMLAKNHLYRLELRLKLEKANLIKLEDILEKEYQDLERFEETPIRNLFHKVLKSKEEQFELEKQEYLHAVLQFKDCKKMIELLEFEREVLKEKSFKEKQIKQQLSSLISQRDLVVSQKYVGFKNAMIALNQQHDQKLGNKKEIHEAIISGLKASDIFKKMIHLLEMEQKENGWGVSSDRFWKVSDGQNGYIDQVHKLSYRAKLALQELEDELEDIYERKSIKRLNRTEEFKHFIDVYYERLISDWIVNNKIVNVLNYLKGTADTLTIILESLKIQLKMTEKAFDYINDRKRKIIEENINK